MDGWMDVSNWTPHARHSPRLTQTTTATPAPAPAYPAAHRGLSTSTSASAAPAAEGSEGSSRDRYVSPHDWGSLVRDYGKSSEGGGVAQVEIRTIKAAERGLEEQGSRYSRRLRKGACGRPE